MTLVIRQCLDARFSAYYIIGIPLGLFLAFSSAFKMGLYGIWIGLTSSLVYGAFVGCWLALRTDWNDEVQRVRSSLNREHQAVLKHTEEETGQPTH
jgi:multidrug resistance protein, MATE family